MIYVQNYKLQSGKRVGKWHKRTPDRNPIDGFPTDCGQHIIKKADEVGRTKPRNLTPVNSCGTCFGPKDWIR